MQCLCHAFAKTKQFTEKPTPDMESALETTPDCRSTCNLDVLKKT